jgi:hypothetical protein
VLLSNQIIVLPSTVQVYYLNNQTSGAFTLTFKTSAVSAATVTVPQGQTLTVICDGTNVFNSNSAAGGTLTSLTINPGSAAAPSLNFAGNVTTGLYQPATNQIAFSVGASNAATITASEFLIPVGISGGAF